MQCGNTTTPRESPVHSIFILHHFTDKINLVKLRPREINFEWVRYLYSPKCDFFHSAFCSFGYASLLRALPSVSREGPALDPAGSSPPAPHAAFAANWHFALFFFFKIDFRDYGLPKTERPEAICLALDRSAFVLKVFSNIQKSYLSSINRQTWGWRGNARLYRAAAPQSPCPCFRDAWQAR